MAANIFCGLDGSTASLPVLPQSARPIEVHVGASVGRFVDPGAVVSEGTPSGIGFAGAGVDRAGVVRRDHDIADRQARLVVKDGEPGLTLVIRFEYTS